MVTPSVASSSWHGRRTATAQTALRKISRAGLVPLDEYITKELWDFHNAPDTIFRRLADPTRRAIFERLAHEGEQTVGALTSRMALYGAFWRDRFDALENLLNRMDQ